MSIRDLSSRSDVPTTTVYRILTEQLKLQSVCSVWVSTVLTAKNKRDRVDCCKVILYFLKGPRGKIADVYCVQDELWINWEVQLSKNQNKCWLKKRAKRLQVVKPKITPIKTTFVIVSRAFQLDSALQPSLRAKQSTQSTSFNFSRIPISEAERSHPSI